MKSLLEYKNLIMSTGLIPTIVCMIFCIFFQDAAVLYVCSLASIIYILYRLVKPPVYQPNLVLLHGTLALIIASIIKRYKRRYAYSGPNSSHYVRNTDTLFFTTLPHGPQFLCKTILLLSL